MGSFYTGNIPYDLNNFINNLGPYSLGEQQDQFLDLSREIEASGQFYWYGLPFPGNADARIAPLVTFGGVITVPSLCYLMMITGDGVVLTNNGNADVSPVGSRSLQGFRLRIFDKGGKMDSFINSQFSFSSSQCPFMELDPTTGTQQQYGGDGVFGPYFPQSPMVVLRPGSLQMELTNMNSIDSVYCQAMLIMAVPVNAASASEVMVGMHRKQ